MSERKNCVRCDRQIDAYARACPYCSWDQGQSPPPPEPKSAPLYVPPDERRWHGKALAVVAFIALVIIAFVVGTFIHGFEPSEVKAAQAKNGVTTTPSRSETPAPAPRNRGTLVPATSSDIAPPQESPITTAPAEAPGQQPNDATALPADQYAAAAARARARKQAAEAEKTKPKPQETPSTPAETSPPQEAQRAVRTNAYPEYKPLPHIAVDHDVTARLDLTVDANGHVTNVDVSEPIPDMPKLIAAVQEWRFKPATENGTPVTSHVSVDITFHANE